MPPRALFPASLRSLAPCAAQTGDLKNAVNNAALVGSILGQLFFGLAGDLFGRKWCFVITSTLIIVGALGSAFTNASGLNSIPKASLHNRDSKGSGPDRYRNAMHVYGSSSGFD